MIVGWLEIINVHMIVTGAKIVTPRKVMMSKDSIDEVEGRINTLIAKSWYGCRYSELRTKQQKCIQLWWEDNQEVLYKVIIEELEGLRHDVYYGEPFKPCVRWKFIDQRIKHYEGKLREGESHEKEDKMS